MEKSMEQSFERRQLSSEQSGVELRVYRLLEYCCSLHSSTNLIRAKATESGDSLLSLL